MNKKWWEFAEDSGRCGYYDVGYLVCPFCETRGVYKLIHHAENKKPGGNKILNYDTYQCGCCANHLLVFWSSSEQEYDPHFNYITLPFNTNNLEPKEEWPESIGKLWTELKECMNISTYQAAAMTARSLLQAILRNIGSSDDRLIDAIDSLQHKGKLSDTMINWAHQIRLLGNEAVHPDAETEIDPQDVRDVVNFIDFLLEYLYTLPKRIEHYRNRRQ